MANHPSAEKRHRQSERRRARNKHHVSTMRTFVKRVNAAVVAKDAKGAKDALKEAIPVIDRTAQRGAIPAKTASRKISRLTKSVNRLSA